MMHLVASLILLAPATFETYVLSVESGVPARVRINDVVVREPSSATLAISHYVVPGANRIFIETAPKSPKVVGSVKLVVGHGDARSGWTQSDGQAIAKLRPGVTIFTAPQDLRTPLWRMGIPIAIDARTLETLHAKVTQLQAMLAAKRVDDYVAQFSASYEETARLFPMAKADVLRDRDIAQLTAALTRSAPSPAPSSDTLTCQPEAGGLLVACSRKRTQETFAIGDLPIALRFMRIDGALRPFAVIPL